MKSIIASIIIAVLCITTSFAQNNELFLQKVKLTLQEHNNLRVRIDTLSNDSYPTLKNEQTRATFKKIISQDYKEILQNTSGLNVKAQFLGEYQNTINKILKKYLAATIKQNQYGIELMYLQGTLIDISAEMVSLLKEFIKTLDRNDESYQVRMDGVKQVKLGLKQQLEGVFIIIRDVQNTSDEERIILSKYLANSGGSILLFLDEAYRKDYSLKIQKQLSVESNQKLKNLLMELILSVQ